MWLLLKTVKSRFTLNIYWMVLIGFLLYLILNRKKMEVRKCIWSIAIFLFFYPIWHLASGIVFYRLMWLFPTFIIIALGMTKLLEHYKGKKGYLLVLGLIVGLLIFGNNIWEYMQNSMYTDNVYHIDHNVIEAADVILGSTSNENITVVGEQEFMAEIRTYSPRFVWGYESRIAMMQAEKRLAKNASYRVATAIQTGYFEESMDLIEDLEELGVQYVILNKSNTCLSENETAYDMIGETEEYQIYKLKYN